jgi:hypothetical protein
MCRGRISAERWKTNLKYWVLICTGKKAGNA